MAKQKFDDDMLGKDFSGKDLTYLKLAGKDLSGTNLTGADLRHTDLTDIKFDDQTNVRKIRINEESLKTAPKEFQELVEKSKGQKRSVASSIAQQRGAVIGL